MIAFSYTIKDKLGIHARPAGSLAKVAKDFKSEIFVELGDKKVPVSKIIAIMGMGIKYNDTVTVTASGEDEKEAAEAIKKFFEDNL